VLDNVAPGQLSVTPNGTLLYSMLPGAAGTSELMWVDRSGRATSFDTAWTGRFEYPAISPDGQRIAVSLRERATELWIRRADGTRRKVIAPLTGSWRPAWHADGKMLTFIGFNDQEKNPNDVTVWQVDQDASAAAQKIFSHRYGVYEAEISPDKQWMLFRADEGAEAGNIYARHTSGDTSLIPLVVGSTNDLQPTLSPDGKRMAYTSNEGGVQQVFVASFPDMKVKRVVSRGPGMEPRWARSGKELFFVSGSRLMSVAIGEGADIPVAEPMPLFPVIGYRRARNRPQYDVAPGDQRFLMIKDPPLPPVPPVVYVENWFPELRAKLKK
jgi:Tol biopolymer transport system component